MAVAAATTQDPAIRSDSAALAHLIASTPFLGLGGAMYLISLISQAYPGVFEGFFSTGRLRPMAMAIILVGWLVPALAGAIYYVLPRLTGTLLWKEAMVRQAAWGYGGVALAAVATIALGLGDGVQPLALPWWMDIPVLGLFSVPVVVAVQTVRDRSERGVYVTLWFVLAGAAWLPLLYLVTNLPGLNAVARSLQEVTMSAGVITLWVMTVGIGVAYYTVVKVTGSPLANRQLARVGFWSLAVAATWAGPAQIAFGPTPTWLHQFAAVLTLALPVAAISNAFALSLTAGDAISKPGEALRATIWGIGFVVLVAALTAIASFGSASALLAFTTFWNGIEYMALFGAGALLVAGWAFQAMPAMAGLALPGTKHARQFIRLTVVGVAATGALLMLAGVLEGFRWAGGSFTGAFVDAGSGWESSPALLTVASLTGFLTLAGQGYFMFTVFRTLTGGVATDREVFVAIEAEDE